MNLSGSRGRTHVRRSRKRVLKAAEADEFVESRHLDALEGCHVSRSSHPAGMTSSICPALCARARTSQRRAGGNECRRARAPSANGAAAARCGTSRSAATSASRRWSTHAGARPRGWQQSAALVGSAGRWGASALQPRSCRLPGAEAGRKGGASALVAPLLGAQDAPEAHALRVELWAPSCAATQARGGAGRRLSRRRRAEDDVCSLIVGSLFILFTSHTQASTSHTLASIRPRQFPALPYSPHGLRKPR